MKQEEKEAANKVSMSIRETEPMIKKVEMLDSGRDGLKVTYQTMEIRNKILSKVNYSKAQKRPTQKDLRVLFASAKEHLLRCCGYHWGSETAKEMLMANVNVTYVQRTEHGQFQIGGKMKVWDHYTTALNTALIKSEDYDEWDELEEILRRIWIETKAFMSGAKGADQKTLVVDYMTAKKDIVNAEESFENMTAEEREQMMKEAMEDIGLTIEMENGEMVVSVADEENESLEPQGFDEDAAPFLGSELSEDATAVSSQNEEEVPVFDESEEDFKIPVLDEIPQFIEEDAPVKKPSKKKKA